MAKECSARGQGGWLGAAIIAMCVLAAAFGPSAAWAQYPEKPVRIIIPYGPGGVADVTIRLVAQKLSEQLGKQFIVDNRPGAGGKVASIAFMSAPADGYTLTITGSGGAISASLFSSLPFDPVTDVAAISILTSFDMLIATRPGSDLGTVANVVSHARANPGKLNLGTMAPGTNQHLSAEWFKILTGVQAAVVTYRSSPELLTGLLRGDIDVGFDYYAAYKAALADQKIRIIATGGDRPSPLLPGVPTVQDSGYKEFAATSWSALIAHRNVPRQVISTLNREVNVALSSPDLRERAAQFGMETKGSTPEEQTERMKAEVLKWRRIIDRIGLPKQ